MNSVCPIHESLGRSPMTQVGDQGTEYYTPCLWLQINIKCVVTSIHRLYKRKTVSVSTNEALRKHRMTARWSGFQGERCKGQLNFLEETRYQVCLSHCSLPDSATVEGNQHFKSQTCCTPVAWWPCPKPAEPRKNSLILSGVLRWETERSQTQTFDCD